MQSDVLRTAAQILTDLRDRLGDGLGDHMLQLLAEAAAGWTTPQGVTDDQLQRHIIQALGVLRRDWSGDVAHRLRRAEMSEVYLAVAGNSLWLDQGPPVYLATLWLHMAGHLDPHRLNPEGAIAEFQRDLIRETAELTRVADRPARRAWPDPVNPRGG